MLFIEIGFVLAEEGSKSLPKDESFQTCGSCDINWLSAVF
jgi:hypothetical protein